MHKALCQYDAGTCLAGSVPMTRDKPHDNSVYGVISSCSSFAKCCRASFTAVSYILRVFMLLLSALVLFNCRYLYLCVRPYRQVTQFKHHFAITDKIVSVCWRIHLDVCSQ